MPVTIIGKDASSSSGISSALQQVTLNSVRKILPDAVIERAARHCGHTYRSRVLSPVVTVLHMILASLWPEESFQASLQLLWDNFVGAFPTLQRRSPSSGSLAKARARLPVGLWDRINESLADKAQVLSEPWAAWRSHRVVLVDGTCVSMPDTPALHDCFGTSTGRGGTRHYPLARMVTLSLANTMSVLSYAMGRYRHSEQALLRPLLKGLRRGDLLIGDRHFAGANLYAEYLACGLHFLTRAHQMLNISRLRRIKGYGREDFVTDLLVNKAYRRQNPTLPKSVRVRVIQATIRTRGRREVMWFVTSLLDDKAYPSGKIVELYARRWRIETLLLQLKRRLSVDVLRSKTPDGVRKEMASCIAALNIVRAIMLESATANDTDPIGLSFTGALRAILAFAPVLATSPPWKLPAIYDAMLREIASCRVRPRPCRHEPRAVRREWKHYPKLKTTRAEWTRQWAA